MSVCYEKSGMKITQLRDRGSEFFPTLVFKVEIEGQKPRTDKISSVEEIQKFMYIVTEAKTRDIEEVYYDLIL
jgi:hypothetical protein